MATLEKSSMMVSQTTKGEACISIIFCILYFTCAPIGIDDNKNDDNNMTILGGRWRPL